MRAGSDLNGDVSDRHSDFTVVMSMNENQRYEMEGIIMITWFIRSGHIHNLRCAS